MQRCEVPCSPHFYSIPACSFWHLKQRDLLVTEESNRLNTGKSDPNKRQVNAPPLVSFEVISGGATDILIECEGQTYHLRKTRNGRLVLNK